MSRTTCSLSAVGGGVSAKKREPRVIGTPASEADEVLQEERHAAERPVRQAVGDRLAPVVVQPHDHRVDRAVARLDALDGRLEQLAGRDLAPPHEIGQTERVVLLVVRERAHASRVRAWAESRRAGRPCA